MPKMKGSQFIANTFNGYGVTHVFFMPVIVPWALREMEKLGIKRIMTHGEKAAAYMADGYARASGRAGICMAQSVGAANMAAGLQDAYLACSPVIALTGRENQINQHRNAYQEVDHLDPFNAVTKYNVLVSQVEQLPYLLRQAFREATSGTPGPVHLDLEGMPGNVIAEGEADLDGTVEEPFAHVPPFRPEPELSVVLAALEILAKAKRPVIVAGGGVRASQAGKELVELAEKLNIPVATSLNAKETFPFDHALAVGICGLYSRSCANQTVGQADLVFFIGSHTGSQVTYGWQIPKRGTPVIQLDINPAELGRSFPITLGMQGDVRATLRKMIDNAEPSKAPAASSAAPKARSKWIETVQQLVRRWFEEVTPAANSDDVPIRPERLCKELTDHLPSDAVLVSDTGHSGIWTGTMVDLKHPGQTYIRAAGSLGWSFPAAMGAKCALPDRPVICFTGDGGIWYHLTELETALRYGINTVTIVNNNHSLNQERNINERVYGGKAPGSDELWILSDADFAKVAESMDCCGIRVDHPREIQSALDQALSCGKPAIIDVKTDIEVISPRPWAPE